MRDGYVNLSDSELPARIRVLPDLEIVILAAPEYERLLRRERQLLYISRLADQTSTELNPGTPSNAALTPLHSRDSSKVVAGSATSLLGKYQLNGSAIRKFRRERKFTQDELAAKVGTKNTAISKMENGRYKSLDFLPALAQALDVDQEDLVEPRRD